MKAIEEYRGLQPEISKLEEYYSGKQWKEDYAIDERGEIPTLSNTSCAKVSETLKRLAIEVDVSINSL